AQAEQVLNAERSGAKSADAEQWAVDRQRRDDRVDAGAIGQSGIHHGRGFVDASPYPRDDAIDGLHQMVIVAKTQIGQLEAALPLDVNRVECVDQDVRDGWVAQERLNGAQPENLVEELLHHLFAFASIEGKVAFGHHLAEQIGNL